MENLLFDWQKDMLEWAKGLTLPFPKERRYPTQEELNWFDEIDSRFENIPTRTLFDEFGEPCGFERVIE